MIIKVSDRGQISIPAAVRKKLGIKPKSKVKVEVGENKIIIRPVKSIDEVAGIFREYAKGKTHDWDTIRAATEMAIAREVEDETEH